MAVATYHIISLALVDGHDVGVFLLLHNAARGPSAGDEAVESMFENVAAMLEHFGRKAIRPGCFCCSRYLSLPCRLHGMWVTDQDQKV